MAIRSFESVYRKKERPLILLVNPPTASHVHRNWNLQKLHSRLHQKLLDMLSCGPRFEFVQNDVVNHVRVLF